MTTQLIQCSNDSELISLWLHGKANTTVKTYSGTIRQFMSFIDKAIADLTLGELQLWHRSLELRYSPATVANKLMAVKSLLSFGFKLGYLATNLGSLIKSPKLKDKLAQRMVAEDDVKRLLSSANNDRDRLLLSLLYGCGLRISEAINLRWEDLYNGKASIFGKGNKNRVVIIPVKLWDELMELKQDKDSNQYIFLSYRGKKLTRSAVHYLLKQACQKAGVSEDISCHWLRHSHASIAINNGCNIRLLQQSLGHSKLETTERYLHINPDTCSSQFINL